MSAYHSSRVSYGRNLRPLIVYDIGPPGEEMWGADKNGCLWMLKIMLMDSSLDVTQKIFYVTQQWFYVTQIFLMEGKSS